jgi:hypothetical protein
LQQWEAADNSGPSPGEHAEKLPRSATPLAT